MNRISGLKGTNFLLAISFAIQAIAGIFLFFSAPPEAIVQIHRYNGIVLVVLTAMHFALNWGWIKANFLNAFDGASKRRKA